MNHIRLFGVLAAVLVSAAQLPAPPGAAKKPRTPVSTETLNTTHELIGPLGKPLGEVVTVTATVANKPFKDPFDDYVTVFSVNGVQLQHPLKMPAKLWPWANIKELKPGQEFTLRAYQDGGMIGVPQQVMNETVAVQTVDHAFRTWLVIINEVRAQK